MLDTQYKASRIFNISIAMALRWLRSEYKVFTNKEIKPQRVGNLNSLRQVGNNDDDNEQEGKVQYPIWMFTIGDMSIDTNKMGGLNKHFGSPYIKTSSNINAGTALAQRLRPVKVALPYSFRTDSMDQLVSFGHMMLMHSPKVSLGMKLTDNYIVEFSLEIEPSISATPQSDESPGQAFIFESFLILNTYIGQEVEVPLIRRVDFGVIEGRDPAGMLERTYFSGDPIQLIKDEYSYLDIFDRSSPVYRGNSEVIL